MNAKLLRDRRWVRWSFRIAAIAILQTSILSNSTRSPLHAQHISVSHKPAATLGIPRPVSAFSGSKSLPIFRAVAEEQSSDSDTVPTPTLDQPRTNWNRNNPQPVRTSYPPAYSSRKDSFLGINNALKKVMGATNSKSDSNQTATTQTSVGTTTTPTTLPDPNVLPKSGPNRTITSSPLPPTGKPIIESIGGNGPAWKWYGYGTITPGGNPHAPDGSYPQTSANWLNQTRATPGAIPLQMSRNIHSQSGELPPNYVREERIDIMPTLRDENARSSVAPNPQLESPIRFDTPPSEVIRPEEPQLKPIPVTTEESLPQSKKTTEGELDLLPRLPPTGSSVSKNPDEIDNGLPPRLPPTGSPIVERDSRGTTITFPIPKTTPAAKLQGIIRPNGTPNPMPNGPTLPLSMNQTTNDPMKLARGISPPTPQPLPKSLTDKVHERAIGANNLELSFVHENRIGIKFSVSKQSEVELVANRIAEMPELSPYYLDFDISVR